MTMKPSLLSSLLLLLPTLSSAQDLRVLAPDELIPGEHYRFERPIGNYRHPDGRCVCTAYITILSTGETVRIAMAQEDCNVLIGGDIIRFSAPDPLFIMP